MATLLLTAVGTAVGGPIGGAIGAFIGRQVDQSIFGSSRQGPRLKELTVTTSSYGQPLPRNFGRTRVAGSIIWSTELQETAGKEGGGKGQPSTTTFSYSASFAVALSSTPIDRIGRIWADGNLLRGAAEDLKVGGEIRVYQGTGDAPVDPLISADRGSLAPAFRDIAYVVFEDLQLSDFGNRILGVDFDPHISVVFRLGWWGGEPIFTGDSDLNSVDTIFFYFHRYRTLQIIIRSPNAPCISSVSSNPNGNLSDRRRIN